MRVYHGGTDIVKNPNVTKGRGGLDFGIGFYITDIKQQAESWADRMARKRLADGLVNIY